MTFRSQKIIALLGLMFCLAVGIPVQAVPTVYEDEAAYLAALSSLGYVSISEGFEEDNFWGLLEPKTTTTVPGVTSQGVRWIGLGGGTNLRHAEARTGDWALESSPEGAPFDGFLATAEQTVFGIGGWLRAGKAGGGGLNDVSALLNGSTTVFDGFAAPNSHYVFWGVIDPAGINSLQFETEPTEPPEPGSGDPVKPSKTVFLDDFTLGFATAPSLREPGTSWDNAAGGTYAAGANWNGGAAPAIIDKALFHLGSATPYTVSLAQNQTASQAVIGSDRVVFNLQGYQYNFTEPNITRESLIVGELPGDVGELTVIGGTLAGVNTVVAHSTGSTGHLTIDTGATVTLSGAMRVGSGGNGTLDIQNSGTLTSAEVSFIGQLGGDGTVNVEGAGASWTVSGFSESLTLGSGGGTGTLNITNGATVTTNGTLVAGKLWGSQLTSDIAGTGTINVDGPGTTLNARNITIAQDKVAAASSAPTSSMNITGGAQVVGQTSEIAVSADANVVVDGPGSSWTMNIGGSSRGTLRVGKGDQLGSFTTFPPPPLHTGTLIIQNGATVEAEQTYIGDTRTGRGVLTVTGVGSTLISGSQFGGNNTFIGNEGDGELNVIEGGTIQTGQAFIGRSGVRDQLRGVANIDGVGSSWTTPSYIWVGYGNNPQIYSGAQTFVSEGVLNVTGGGTVSSSALLLADRKVSIGIVNITGSGSKISTDKVALGNPFNTTFTFGSNAEMLVADSGLLEVTGNVDLYHGKLTLDGGTIEAAQLRLHGEELIDPATNQFETGDMRVTLTGSGQVNADLTNGGGHVEPGLGAGLLNVLGNYIQNLEGTLAIELGGTDNSDPMNLQFDQLLVDGAASLGGTLDVSLLDLGSGALVPGLGDSFDILTATGGISGTFDSEVLPTLDVGLQWHVEYGASEVRLDVLSLLTADFDTDGDVDGADLTTWETAFGGGTGADADADGDSDGADFLAWQRQFTGPAVSQAASTVPEPSAAVLAALAGLVAFGRRRRSKSAPSQ